MNHATRKCRDDFTEVFCNYMKYRTQITPPCAKYDMMTD